MTLSKLLTFIFLLTFAKNYSQEKYIVNYENGKSKTESFLKNNTLDSIYKEYYENGNLKTEGFYKNCDYKTNRKSIYVFLQTCGIPNKKDSIKDGKKQGTWKHYYENGILSHINNFHCNIIQGNYYSYTKEGKLETIEFYNEGHLIYSQDYNENGIIVETSNHKYEFGKPENFKKSNTFEFYDNGDLKSENIIDENNEKEIEFYKEYYSNGFLKIEKNTINGNRNGVYREYYENGNLKHEGIYKEDIPTKKQYYYKENGQLIKVETWRKGKVIKTENK